MRAIAYAQLVSRPRWKLTVRHGSEVDHASFKELGVSSLRDYGPEQQVHARLQLSGKRWLHKPVAGIDVRGDGTFMPYCGGVRREELDPSKHETPFELVRETLESDG